MHWKTFVLRRAAVAAMGGITFTAIYFGLLFTTSWHGFAVKMLGPAIDLAYRIDPRYRFRSHAWIEELAINAMLYAFWIFVALVVIRLVSLAGHRAFGRRQK